MRAHQTKDKWFRNRRRSENQPETRTVKKGRHAREGRNDFYIKSLSSFVECSISDLFSLCNLAWLPLPIPGFTFNDSLGAEHRSIMICKLKSCVPVTRLRITPYKDSVGRMQRSNSSSIRTGSHPWLSIGVDRYTLLRRSAEKGTMWDLLKIKPERLKTSFITVSRSSKGSTRNAKTVDLRKVKSPPGPIVNPLLSNIFIPSSRYRTRARFTQAHYYRRRRWDPLPFYFWWGDARSSDSAIFEWERLECYDSRPSGEPFRDGFWKWWWCPLGIWALSKSQKANGTYLLGIQPKARDRERWEINVATLNYRFLLRYGHTGRCGTGYNGVINWLRNLLNV